MNPGSPMECATKQFFSKLHPERTMHLVDNVLPKLRTLRFGAFGAGSPEVYICNLWGPSASRPRREK